MNLSMSLLSRARPDSGIGSFLTSTPIALSSTTLISLCISSCSNTHQSNCSFLFPPRISSDHCSRTILSCRRKRSRCSPNSHPPWREIYTLLLLFFLLHLDLSVTIWRSTPDSDCCSEDLGPLSKDRYIEKLKEEREMARSLSVSWRIYF